MDKKIKGVQVTRLKIFKDNKGSILHMIKKNSKVFKSFGEIYFSTINPGIIKGWNLHKKMTINLVCIKGKVKIVLYDDRKNSKTFKRINEFELSRKKYFLLTIPPKIWCGFKNLHKGETILANCASIQHSAGEMEKRSNEDKLIPYKW